MDAGAEGISIGIPIRVGFVLGLLVVAVGLAAPAAASGTGFASAATPTTIPSGRTAADRCAADLALGEAGQYQQATSDLVSLLTAEPRQPCASADLKAVLGREVRAECQKGDLDEAKKQYEAAIAAAPPGPSVRCAADGLKDVADRTSSIQPGWWRENSATILHVAAGIGVGLAMLAVAGAVLLFLGGWMARFANRFVGKRLRNGRIDIRLVPRLKLSDLTGPADSPAAALTPLLRAQMQAVQTTDDLRIDFASSDSKVQGMVTAVKDLNSTAGSIGEVLLAVVSVGVWPWKTISVQGQVLVPGAQGEGLSVAVGVNARQPSGASFWRFPNATEPVPADAGGVSQRYYDLIPAVATWAVYESARLGGTADRDLTEAGARCHGYLAAGYAVAASGRPDSAEDALRFYHAASAADPESLGARLAIVLNENVKKQYMSSIDDMRQLLADSWLASWDSLDSKVWGV